MFRLLDFVIFGLFLSLSVLVGVYHGIAAKLRKFTHSNADEYLTGGHNLPVCLSLLTTFISGIALLGIPSEIYMRGASMGAAHLVGAIGFLFVGLFFIPMFYKLRFVNVYEYFEYRFDSRFLRTVGTSMFILNTSIYMAIVIYAPAIALSGAASLPLWPFVLAVGVVGTVYTAVGGIKAVIWTDTLQAIFLVVGLGTLLIKGTLDAAGLAGGLSQVLWRAEKTERLSGAIFRLDPNPLQYNNMWIATFGGVVHAMSLYGLNQMALQRYCAMPSLREANIVLAITVPAHLIVGLMAIYLGVLCFGFFLGCDPVAMGEITTHDQIAIALASKVLGPIPGLPGVFLSTVFSATLSTISSGLNSMTAVIWEDFLKERYSHGDSPKADRIMKLIAISLGILATAMAYACQVLGGIFHVAVATLGAMSGPIAGVFILGLFFPSANKNGAIISFFCSSGFMVLIAILFSLEKPFDGYILPMSLNESTSPACVDSATAARPLITAFYSGKSILQHYGAPGITSLARLSPFAYAITGILLTVLIGLPLSWVIPQKYGSRQKRNIAFACTFQGLDIPLGKVPITDVPEKEPMH